MFPKLDEAAKEFSTRVSRRGFLDRVGQTALTAATALGAFLALQSSAGADTGQKCCSAPYTDENGNVHYKYCRLRKGEKTCPPNGGPVPCYIPFKGELLTFCDEL